MSIIGYGESAPLVDNTSESGSDKTGGLSWSLSPTKILKIMQKVVLVILPSNNIYIRLSLISNPERLKMNIIACFYCISLHQPSIGMSFYLILNEL